MTVSYIQRWAPFDPMALMGRHPNGAFVTYADHVAAVAAAREDERGKTIVSYDLMKQRKSYEQGQRDERERLLNKLAERGVGTIDYLLAVLDEEK